MDNRQHLKRWQEPNKSQLIVENEQLRVILSSLLNTFLGTPQAFFKFVKYHISRYDSGVYHIIVICQNVEQQLEKRIVCDLTEDIYLELARKVHAWQEI